MTRSLSFGLLVLVAVALVSCTGAPPDPGPPAEPGIPMHGGDARFIDLQEQDVIYLESGWNGGTTTIFPHRRHSYQTGLSCYTCHHQDLEGDKPRACTATQCHLRGETVERIVALDKALHIRCIECHERMNAENPKWNTAIECIECHIPNSAQQEQVE